MAENRHYVAPHCQPITCSTVVGLYDVNAGFEDACGAVWRVDLTSAHMPKTERILKTHGGPIMACSTSPVTSLVASIGTDGKAFLLV